MRKLVMMAMLLSACGDDTPAAKAKPTSGSVVARSGEAAVKPASLSLRAKVDKQYRKELSPADFQPDPTGDINRDPWASYLVVTPQNLQASQKDDCEGRTHAEKYSYGEMKLMAIIVRGTKNMAMFRDPQGVGQMVNQGDCLAKDKARIIEVTPSCVRIELRGEAPPGAPAPPAHEDKRCLHPNDIEIE
jgi:Tfp pilus assembly protein PilP